MVRGRDCGLWGVFVCFDFFFFPPTDCAVCWFGTRERKEKENKRIIRIGG